MKKVLIFSLAYYPHHVGGAEVAIREITGRINPQDIEFHLVTLRFGDDEAREEQIGNVFVHRVGFGSAYVSKILFIPLAAWTARALHRTHRFDALWAVMTYMLFPLVIARMFGVRVPYVLSLQDGDPYERVFGSWYILPFLPVLDWGIRHAAFVHAISHSLAAWPRRRGFTGEVLVIPNGASNESLKEYPLEELEMLRNKVGKKAGDVILLSVARLVRQKAVDVVIRALALLPAHVRLVVAGKGPEEEALVALAKELGVFDRITFFGHVDRTMTAKYRKISDIFVVPSRSEGQGISFASSMFAHLPVIATREGGLADVIFDGRTAWAVPKDSPEHVASAVKDILAHPDKVKTITDFAYKFALEKFNWDTIAHDMHEKVFEPVINT